MSNVRVKPYGPYIIAGYLMRRLSRACNTMMLAGSARRGVLDPHDVELVVVVDDWQAFEDTLEALQLEGSLTRGQDESTGRKWAWGKKQRAFNLRLKNKVWKVELYMTTPPQYGLQLALRTGPADLMKTIVTGSTWGGLMPDGMAMQEGYLWQNEVRLTTETEEQFFYLLNLRYFPAHQRTVELLTQWSRYDLLGLEAALLDANPSITFKVVGGEKTFYRQTVGGKPLKMNIPSHVAEFVYNRVRRHITLEDNPTAWLPVVSQTTALIPLPQPVPAPNDPTLYIPYTRAMIETYSEEYI